ncbi:oxidoreductase [Nostoc sp. 2RC]|uniref:oxidoreductase n=1 Tax=Nostoc sp. 2RC TaxID=2485484 RepID=UPI00162502E3|nr:oxidoreductase [Nostoc sp. 2RC]MBC1242048.1 SDR family NAD(P)-dependent oxidoreductase [Nostoc sp. 2RC]
MIKSSSIETKVWLITGTSKGLGRALAETVLEQGDTVVLTARNPELIQDLAASFPENTLAVQLDVTKPEEIQAAIKQAIAKFGRIDVLVNNAGYGILGAIEEVSNAEVRRQFETNFFGVLEVLRTVLPYMRQQGSGHIVNISSVGGFVGYAGTGIYNGTKFALEGISEALAQEVTPLGIKIIIVEPGAFRTEFVTRSLVIADSEIKDYEIAIGEMRQGARDILDNQLEFQEPGNPKKAALAIIKAVNSENPPLRLALGEDAIYAINAKLESVKTELDAWKEVSFDTAFDELMSTSA